jgi:hypothetical protein
MGSYKRFVRNLNLTPDEEELILWRNTARLFRIDVTSIPGKSTDAVPTTPEPMP